MLSKGIHWIYSVVVDIIIIVIIFPISLIIINTLFLIQVYLSSEFCPSVLQTAGLDFLLGTSETLLCSMFACLGKKFPLLDALQILCCLEPVLFF
jgi:hypothetical protein